MASATVRRFRSDGVSGLEAPQSNSTSLTAAVNPSVKAEKKYLKKHFTKTLVPRRDGRSLKDFGRKFHFEPGSVGKVN